LGAIERSEDVEAVLVNTTSSHPDALVASGNPQIQAHNRRIANFVIEHGILPVSAWHEMTREGFFDVPVR
jgi:hypothetical protein